MANTKSLICQQCGHHVFDYPDTLGQKAEANIRKLIAMTDAEGAPIATPESIREVAAQLPESMTAHLLADPGVVDLVLKHAIGIDSRIDLTLGRS